MNALRRIFEAAQWALALSAGFIVGTALAGLLTIFIDYGAWFWWTVGGASALAVAWHWRETRE